MPNQQLYRVILFLSLLFTYSSQAQEVFVETEAGKQFTTTPNNTFFVEGNWRHILTESGWNRFGLSVWYRKDLKNHWSIAGGLDNYLVSDKKTANYNELRPWAMVSLKSKVTDRLTFHQYVKTEWRHYFYSEYYDYDNYNRLRYRVLLDLDLGKTKNKSVSHAIKPGVEWFLMDNPSTGERYTNSREYSLKYTRSSLNKEWSIAYKFETFYKTFNPNSLNANTFFIEYKF
ncbi:hypothetical protein V7S76_12100 [Aquirufa sp. ROCK2-A2]